MRLPKHEWIGLDSTCIHAVVLFADIQNSVLISSALSLREYDELINAFQRVMLDLVNALKSQGMPIGEAQVAGDQLSIFFYDSAEVERNYRLDGPRPAQGQARERAIAEGRASNQNLVFSALKAAVQFKNLWLAQDFNIERVVNHHAPFEVSIGINYGRVYLRDRPDGKRRIEGYTVNLAKRIESSSQYGRYSFIMLGQDACETLRSMVVRHTQLRQRIFFHRHELQLHDMKGVIKPQPIYELKFCHRITVPGLADAVPQHEAIFAVDPTRIWSYYQLVEHYGYVLGDWRRAYELSSRAHVMNPQDEKVKFDLAFYHMQLVEYQMSLVYCKQALELNPEFDLAYELLGTIANKLDRHEDSLAYMRNAVSLSPGSAANHLNLGLLLTASSLDIEAVDHIAKAIAIYPGYGNEPEVVSALRALGQRTSLPSELKKLLRKPRRARSKPATEN